MSEDAQDVVLVVEDDPSIMTVLSAYLSGVGYRVLEAESSDKAFEILASKPHLDMMITDFRLPGVISGVQIAEPAVKLRPELKVIFISGYAQEVRDTDSPITRKAPILDKPFDLDELQSIMRSMLS
ncbi:MULTISPECIES: response regulator [unclassified Pseudomonas]|jgi:DNA-binding NtrC family response regulator|uniref:response regulator n=1 Tax=unclassified Pseudomonas TaxID=196821 RepID=UPI00119B7982|nr:MULTISPECIES: response regulator [unclassified Pseudomonas]TWC23001.1 response regulator receiver domain-containing protein [Pseudomonas sp. SJZ075]TWC24735.1 response regulator receiver domain-containing protein [Pseudomonas sp. SJZ074]TWC38119.1 response regulator receiver domain-containing protein [Pseudomonas sp. SJZ078]TWC41048.1 response regulator receiver domain-containing protein [Pseudomonas sp. SJZ085]TWC58709.1 response regulator receiver domain-containing protein [Pseudomonas sp